MKTVQRKSVVGFVVKGAVASTAIFSVGMAGMAAQGAWRAYYANDEVGRNVVSILSQAPLETMLIHTNKVTADIRVDANNVLNAPKAVFEVDTASLDTGIEMRNEHMRGEQWINAAKYPRIIFTLNKVISPRKATALKANTPMKGEVEGTLNFHGVSKPVRAQVEINSLPGDANTKARLDGDLLHVRATFPLRLNDFGVNVPQMAQMKVANEQQVTVDVFSSTGSKQPILLEPIKEEAAAGAAATTTGAAMTETTTTKTLAGGLKIEDLTVGTGDEAKSGKSVTVNYRGTLADGKQFDASYDRNEPFTFNLGAGNVIPGWDKGLVGMKVGGKRRLTIPPALAYGAEGTPGGPIPPNATLTFEVELLKVG